MLSQNMYKIEILYHHIVELYYLELKIYLIYNIYNNLFFYTNHVIHK